MADLGREFDATTVDPSTVRAALPTGWYPMVITHDEIKATKPKPGEQVSNNGLLELTLKVISGPHAGSQAWDRLNLWNQNPVAVEIAQKTLSAICHATGVFKVRDASVLANRPMDVYLEYVAAEPPYKEKNDVKGYAAYGTRTGNGAAAVPAQAPSLPTTPPSFAPPVAAPPPPPAYAPAPAAPTGFTPPGAPPAPTGFTPPGAAPPAAPAGPGAVPPWAK